MKHRDLKTRPNCSPRSLQEYLDGELPQHQESTLLEHISTCKACNEELNFHKSVFEKTRELENEIEIPSNFAEVTGLPLGTVKNRLFRAREMMREIFVDRGFTGI